MQSRKLQRHNVNGNMVPRSNRIIFELHGHSRLRMTRACIQSLLMEASQAGHAFFVSRSTNLRIRRTQADQPVRSGGLKKKAAIDTQVAFRCNRATTYVREASETDKMAIHSQGGRGRGYIRNCTLHIPRSTKRDGTMYVRGQTIRNESESRSASTPARDGQLVRAGEERVGAKEVDKYLF